MPERDLQTQPPPADAVHKNNAAADFLRSAAYAAFQEPASGLAQIVDAVAKTDLTAKVQFMDAPKASDSNTDWFAQQAGGAVGMLVPFLIAKSGVRYLSGESKLAGGVGQLKLAPTFSASIKEAGLTGFAYSSVFHPSDQKSTQNLGDFIAARVGQGTAGAATFMTLTGVGFGLSKLGGLESLQQNAVLRSSLVPILKNPISAGVLSGVPAGFISAEANALAAGKWTPSGGEVKQSVSSMAMIGGLFGVGQAAFGGRSEVAGTGRSLTENETINRAQQISLPEPRTESVVAVAADGVHQNEGALNVVRQGEKVEAPKPVEAPETSMPKSTVVRAGEAIVAGHGESYFASADSHVTADSGSRIFAQAGSDITARSGSIVVADMNAKVISEPGAIVIRNEILERDARDAHADAYTVGPGKAHEQGATVVKDAPAIAIDGDTMVAESGSTIVAKKGAKVFAKEGSHVIAEDGSEVIARFGSRVTARTGSNVKAYEGANVIAQDGSNVQAWLQSRIIAERGANVDALSQSDVVALQGSNIVAGDSSTIHAFAGANIKAEANSQILHYGDVNLTANPESFVHAVDGAILTARPGMTVHAEKGSIVYAADGSNVIAKEGSKVIAERGSKVTAYSLAETYARAGSYVKSRGGSLTYALDGSTVYGEVGAAIVASEGSTVHASAGSHVFAAKGAEVYALPDSTVVAEEGAIVHAASRARVISDKDFQPTQLSDEFIKSPIPSKLSPSEAVAWMQQLSKDNQVNVRRFIQDLEDKYGVDSGFNFKDADKIESKASRPSILERKPWHDVSHIRDAFRFKSVLDDITILPKIVDELRQREGWQIVKVDVDKALNPGEWGWRIIAFDLRMPNGQLVEYYLPVRELEAAKKDGNHLLFEKWRNRAAGDLTDGEEAERQRDLQASRDKYNDAWQAYLARINQTEDSVGNIIEQVRTMDPNR